MCGTIAYFRSYFAAELFKNMVENLNFAIAIGEITFYIYLGRRDEPRTNGCGSHTERNRLWWGNRTEYQVFGENLTAG